MAESFADPGGVMKWCKVLPDRPGYYWRMLELGEGADLERTVQLLHVVERDRQLWIWHAAMFTEALVAGSAEQFWWAGPVDPPRPEDREAV